MDISFLDLLNETAKNPGADARQTYEAVQKVQLEEKRSQAERALLRPYESAVARMIRELAEAAPAGRTAFQAGPSEIALAKAKCGVNATEPQLIESIKQRREWEAANPGWADKTLRESWIRAPKAAHGRPVARTGIALTGARESSRTSNEIELREEVRLK